MPNAVFVLGHDQRPLQPVHPALARRMLNAKAAAVFRRYPFTIICQAGSSTGSAEFGFPFIQTQAKHPLKDAAAVNATRWALFHQLCITGLPVECGTGGRTKYNRTRLALPKTHWLDAAGVGASTPESLHLLTLQAYLITSVGRGSRQRCRTNAHGFPRRYLSRGKRHFGFQTGDIVHATVPRGTHIGVHVGRVTVRQRASFNLKGKDIHVKYIRLVHRADGYDYGFSPSIELSEKPSYPPSNQTQDVLVGIPREVTDGTSIGPHSPGRH